jgi:hypothetical protein
MSILNDGIRNAEGKDNVPGSQSSQSGILSLSPMAPR